MGKTVTAAPYTETQWWQSLLKQTSNFSWWNLQLYGGADYGDWVQDLQGLTSNPQSFLTCGYKTADGWSPAEVTTALQETQKQYAGLSGAFIWRYEDIRGQASAYAAAMIQGLS
ncbi:MAG: hypothetical protein ACRYFV_20605 [Janthinobacterium lividum]